MDDELNITSNNSWQSKKYIYLDWNVYKYLSEPRQDKRNIDVDMLNLIKKLKSIYIFPYSEGHIKDRANKYSGEHREQVEKDFAFAETINDRYLLIPNSMISDSNVAKGMSEIVIAKQSMLEYFDAFIDRPKGEFTNTNSVQFENFTINKEEINEDNPFYEFLANHGWEMNPSNLNVFLDEMLHFIFDDVSIYKKFRSYVKKLDSEKILNQPMEFNARVLTDRLLYYMCPMLDSMDDDEEKLSGKWKGICHRWFSMSGSNITEEQLLKEGYALLDFHPLFNDKLKKGKNTLDNIIRDGSHCYYASRAKYFVSEDDKTRKKVKFMYKAFGIKTRVCSEEEFLKNVSVA